MKRCHSHSCNPAPTAMSASKSAYPSWPKGAIPNSPFLHHDRRDQQGSLKRLRPRSSPLRSEVMGFVRVHPAHKLGALSNQRPETPEVGSQVSAGACRAVDQSPVCYHCQTGQSRADQNRVPEVRMVLWGSSDPGRCHFHSPPALVRNWPLRPEGSRRFAQVVTPILSVRGSVGLARHFAECYPQRPGQSARRCCFDGYRSWHDEPPGLYHRHRYPNQSMHL